jgi:hypothetical protein
VCGLDLDLRYSPTSDKWAAAFVKKLARVRVDSPGEAGGGGGGELEDDGGAADIEVGISGANVGEGKLPLVNGEIRSDTTWLTVAAKALESPYVVKLLAGDSSVSVCGPARSLRSSV